MLKKTRKPVLEKLHKLIFRFDTEIQIHGWSWLYWINVHPEVSPCGGEYRSITDGWLCFQRRYTY